MAEMHLRFEDCMSFLIERRNLGKPHGGTASPADVL